MSGLSAMATSNNEAALQDMFKKPTLGMMHQKHNSGDSDSELTSSQMADPNSLENRLKNIRANLNYDYGAQQKQAPAYQENMQKLDISDLDDERKEEQQSEILIKSSARKIDQIEQLLSQRGVGLADHASKFDME